MIQVQSLAKRYGHTKAVEDLSFEVRPGRVTGFLGPNGSGKSTTMRIILGLDAPDAGRALVDGRPFQDLPWPLREVGAHLDAEAFHPGRSAENHLVALAQANGIDRSRVPAALDIVGLASMADKRAGTFSLGMKQRLGIASALLGDPGTLLFDEPINGLDPDGIRWIRNLVRGLAAEGRNHSLSNRSHPITPHSISTARDPWPSPISCRSRRPLGSHTCDWSLRRSSSEACPASKYDELMTSPVCSSEEGCSG